MNDVYQWLNIRRGQILCAFIGGWVICPWEILGTLKGAGLSCQ